MRYNTSKLYLIQLAQVTHIKESGMFTQGKTYYEEIKYRYFVAQKMKHTWYSDPDMKLVLSKIKFYSESKRTKRPGDFFALQIIPLLSFDYKRRYISKKQIKQLEKEMAEYIHKLIEEQKQLDNKEKEENNV